MRIFLLAGTILLLLFGSLESRAQMFGSRTLGSPLSRRPSPGAVDSESVGSIQGNERFLRGNRNSTDFVGTDRTEVRDFVGLEQSAVTGRVRSAVEGLRIERAANANRQRAATGPTPLGIYEPKLRIAFDYAPPAPETLAETIREDLQAAQGLEKLGSISVSVEGRTATLRGEVASERARKLAESFVLFEPGIERVRNELTLPRRETPPGQPIPPRLEAPREPASP